MKNTEGDRKIADLKSIQPTREMVDAVIAGDPSGDPAQSRQLRHHSPAMQ